VVSSPAGEPMGSVKSVNNFGAGDLLEIAPGDGSPTWWAPFTLEVVPEVRLADGVIIVDRRLKWKPRKNSAVPTEVVLL